MTAVTLRTIYEWSKYRADGLTSGPQIGHFRVRREFLAVSKIFGACAQRIVAQNKAYKQNHGDREPKPPVITV